MPPKPSPSEERTCTTASACETRGLGRALALCVRPGDLLCLRGDLGAGKTTLVQGLAEGLGVVDPVTSPSFTLVHEHQGRIPLYHLDLFRLRAEHLADIGIDDIIGGEGVVAVEWSERLPPSLCTDGIDVALEEDAVDEDKRLVRLRARGPRGREMIQALAEAPDAPAWD